MDASGGMDAAANIQPSAQPKHHSGSEFISRAYRHAMQCNIDARGRLARFVGGVIALIAAVVLFVLMKQDLIGGSVALAAALVCLAFGIVGVIQGWAGICVIRAMGFKTRL